MCDVASVLRAFLYSPQNYHSAQRLVPVASRARPLIYTFGHPRKNLRRMSKRTIELARYILLLEIQES